MSDLVDRLNDDATQLDRMMAQAAFSEDTYVRVKSPLLLVLDLKEAASRISQQDAELERMRRENKALSELRRDLITLQKRIIGETGLSAIETIDRALKVFDAKHLYEVFDEDRAKAEETGR